MAGLYKLARPGEVVEVLAVFQASDEKPLQQPVTAASELLDLTLVWRLCNSSFLPSANISQSRSWSCHTIIYFGDGTLRTQTQLSFTCGSARGLATSRWRAMQHNTTGMQYNKA
jgi:hypothetical protein